MRNRAWETWASSNEVWQEGHSKVPSVSWDGTVFTISEFRNFRYGDSGVEGGFETRSFDVAELESMEIFSIPFGKTGKLSHLIGSFAFSDGARLALSVEARRRPGEDFSVVKGCLGHFGLSYVWGSERDLLGMRLIKRRDRMERYEFDFGHTDETALRHLLDRTASLSRNGETYHSVTRNCTTELLSSVLGNPRPFWKLSPNVLGSSRFWRTVGGRHPLLRATEILPERFVRAWSPEGTESEFSDILRKNAEPFPRIGAENLPFS